MANIYGKVMRVPVQALSLFLLVGLGSLSAHCVEIAPSVSSWQGYALITAMPTSARAVSREHQGAETGLAIGSEYRVALRNVEVVYGEFPTKRFSIALFASQPTAITAHQRIFILLQVSEGREPKALSWGVPTRILCIPEGVIEDAGIGADFFDFKMLEGNKCTNAEWFQ